VVSCFVWATLESNDDVTFSTSRHCLTSVLRGYISELNTRGAASASPLPTLAQVPLGSPGSGGGGARLNKFVRRLYDMLQAEKDAGIVEWRRGLLVLHSTDAFAKTTLPKYFNTRNFKTFRRQVSSSNKKTNRKGWH
jgi:hypothetical protein